MHLLLIRTAWLCCLVLICPSMVTSKVVVSGLFSDHMVLQTNYEGGFRPFLHGTASAGEIVRLVGAPSRTAGNTAFFATAGDDGLWTMQLDPHITRSVTKDRYNLTLSGSADGHTSSLIALDVVFGEVHFVLYP